MNRLSVLFIFLCFHSDSISQNLHPGEGFVNVKGGRIWYKIVGSGNKTPLLIIHGGPGSSSCNSIPGYALLSNDRPVIFYDQLGSGHSDRPTDTTLWVLPRFVDEVVSLRKELGLEKVHILGNSWGAAVLIEYMLTKNPRGVESAIFSGPLLSTPLWIEDAKVLLSELPKNLQDTISKYEQLKDYTAPQYMAATDSFYSRHMVVTKGPHLPPAECDGVSGFNRDVYNYMWGPTEFSAPGTLRTFDRVGRLHELKTAVLFIGGRYDEVRPETIYKLQKLVAGSKAVIIENAGHAKIIDQPLKFTSELREFLNGVRH